MYPAIYLIASLFAVINRVQNAADPDHPVFALYLLQSLFSPMQGIRWQVAVLRGSKSIVDLLISPSFVHHSGFINAVAYAFAGDFWRSCNRQDIARVRLLMTGQMTEYATSRRLEMSFIYFTPGLGAPSEAQHHQGAAHC